MLVLGLVSNLSAYSETIHQTMQGEDAFISGGGMGSALSKGVIEVKSIPDADGGKVGRVVGTAGQWAFVSFWFGQPAPAGKVIIRFKVYNDGSDIAAFGVYTDVKGAQNLVTRFHLPPDAKKDSFVTIDVPFTSADEWSGLVFKKIENSTKPGPWIDSVSIVLP